MFGKTIDSSNLAAKNRDGQDFMSSRCSNSDWESSVLKGAIYVKPEHDHDAA